MYSETDLSALASNGTKFHDRQCHSYIPAFAKDTKLCFHDLVQE